MSALRHPVTLLLVSALTLGCGVHGAGGATTTPQVQVSELPAPKPSASHYSTDSTPHPPGTAAELARAVVDVGASMQRPIATDGRLAALGQWAAQHSEGGQLPPHGPIDEAATRLGIVEATPALVVYRTGDAQALIAHVRNDIADLVDQRGATHVGVGVVEQGNSITAVVVLSERRLTLEPITRLPGAVPDMKLSGSLTGGLTDPVLVVMRPDGTVTRAALGKGPAFSTRAQLGPAGAYRIELLATGGHGTTVVANFPVLAGVEEPPTIRVETPVGDAEGDVSGALLALIARDRAQVGLGPLARREDLDAVALGHSRDMDENDFIGHTSPTTGGVGDRVRAAGIQTPLALENIGRDYSATAVHAALMASPGHRANILDPRVTHVGIDLVRQQEGTPGEPGSREALLVTQVFIRVIAELDPEEAADEGIEELGTARRKRGLPALERDGILDDLAARGAVHYFSAGQPSQEQAMQKVNAAMADTRLPYSRVQALALVAADIDIARVEALLDPEARAIGVAFAQGERGDARVNPTTIAVILLGY